MCANVVSDLSLGEGPLNGPSPVGDRGTIPTEWLSYRFTTSNTSLIRDLLIDTTHVWCYEYSQKDVDHFHALVIGGEKVRDLIKKRKKRDDESKKMLAWSNLNKGTFLGALAYTLKTVDNPPYQKNWEKSPDFPDFEYTPWVFHPEKVQSTLKAGEDDHNSKPSRQERDWQLTYSNLVCQAVKHHRANGLKDGMSLKQVVGHMLETTKWRPSHQLVCSGVNEFYHNDFEFRLGKRKHQDLDWMVPRDR